MKVVFLDRDGVINQFPGHGAYVTRVKDLRFIRGSKKAIALLTQAGYKIFVISNQAGVGRGIFTQKKLDQIDARLKQQVRLSGGCLTRTLYCTHHPDAKCGCRKPGIDNVRKAAGSIGKKITDLKGCFFIGDAGIDMKTGKAANLKTVLVLSGKSTHAQVMQEGGKPDYVVANLRDAVKIVLNEDPSHTRHSRSRA